MTDTKFSQLSSLVLVDILAALPMEHVVRMARLGHERLRHTCSLKWVKDRMTGVTFEAVLRSYELGGHIADTFCVKPVTKRLKGDMKLSSIDLGNARHCDAYVSSAKQIEGNLHLRVEDVLISDYKKVQLEYALCTLPKLIYTSQIYESAVGCFSLIRECPGLVFQYHYASYESGHHVYYRPAKLNRRHILDVLRAVCGPADVSEAELDRMRRYATDRARSEDRYGEKWKGVMWTCWWGVAIIAKQ